MTIDDILRYCIRGREEPINRNNSPGLSWEWMGVKLFMCCLSLGEKRENINQLPRK